ncbi:MAG TPA: ATP-binding protein [Alphaproteobacteria bacterium]|nr:ATP-binding protein [Alphaproteobacteria bacterium]
MAKPRVPLKRIFVTAVLVALPGLIALGAGTVIGIIGPGWLMAGALVCCVIAWAVASVLVGDLTAVAAYGDQLSHHPDAPEPDLTGWGPAANLASLIRRFAREARRREQTLIDGMTARQMVFDALPQPLILLDESRRIVTINRTGRELIGIDPVGSDLSAAIRDPRVLEVADTALSEGVPGATNFIISDPVERYFSVQAAPLQHQGGDGAALLVALFDLTERRRAEQMRGDFIANVSHELRTPLASLIGFIETLRGPAREDAEARDRFLGLMSDQAERMSRLVEDLLSLSAIELAEHTRPADKVDITATLGTVTDGLQMEAQAKDMEIRREVGPDLPPVLGKSDQLAQLLTNLMDNAIKYGRPGTPVTVSIRFEPDVPAALAPSVEQAGGPGVVRVEVRDEGEGIAAEHIPRLTERFYRVDTARSRAVGGTGLGLAIVKHIVAHHRGLLEIDSTEGEGSTFSVTLPAAASEEKVEQHPPPD